MKLKMIPIGNSVPDTGDSEWIYIQYRDGTRHAMDVVLFRKSLSFPPRNERCAIVAYWPIPVPRPHILPADLTKDLKKPCWFWDNYESDKIIGELTAVKASGAYKYKSRTRWFKNYRLVKPEDIGA